MLDTHVMYFHETHTIAGFAVLWNRVVHGYSMKTRQPVTFYADGRFDYPLADCVPILVDHDEDKAAGYVQSVTKTSVGLFVLGKLWPNIVTTLFSPLRWQVSAGQLFFSPTIEGQSEQGTVNRLKGGVISEFSLTCNPGTPPRPGRRKQLAEWLDMGSEAAQILPDILDIMQEMEV